jgi:hypothetical protein
MNPTSDVSKRPVPCFLCGNGLEIKHSKRLKPYLVCDHCGMQIFVRGNGGIKLLANREMAMRCEVSGAPGDAALEITSLSNRLRELRAMLSEIDVKSVFGFFETERPERLALEAEIRKAEARLKRMAGELSIAGLRSQDRIVLATSSLIPSLAVRRR